MAADHETFKRELLDKLLAVATDIAAPQVGRWSRALAAAMRAEVESATRGRLYIPHYWAVYVNDGRAGFSASRTTFLVWFRNPEDDPRFNGSTTPERASQVRRLTRDEWKTFLAENNRARKNGQPPPMIVARHVGPVTAKKFFDNDGGMSSFFEQASDLAQVAFSAHVRDYLGKLYSVDMPHLKLRL